MTGEFERGEILIYPKVVNSDKKYGRLVGRLRKAETKKNPGMPESKEGFHNH